MSQNLSDAPHGMNLVIETTSGTVYIGRFDESNGFEALLHDVDVGKSKGIRIRKSRIWSKQL